MKYKIVATFQPQKMILVRCKCFDRNEVGKQVSLHLKNSDYMQMLIEYSLMLGNKYLFTWKFRSYANIDLNIHQYGGTQISVHLKNSDHMEICILIYLILDVIHLDTEE